MKIIIGSDHAAFDAKNALIAVVRELGHDVTDAGPETAESCDYPDFAAAVCAGVNDGTHECGLLLCGTGIGMSIAANKIRGIRAALCRTILDARFARAHNNANVLCLGARMVGDELMKEMTREFLQTGFDGGRHSRRLSKIEDARPK